MTLVSLYAPVAVLSVSVGYRYQAKLSTENEKIADWLLRLSIAHKRWGFGLCFLYLRNIKGYGWDHKRVYRIYRELELNLRIKPKRRIKRDKPEALSVPEAANQVWSMDFMSDTLSDGRSIRTFNVIDDTVNAEGREGTLGYFNREGLGIDVDLSLPSSRVIRSLEHIIEWRGKPLALRCDNGPEYISQLLKDWTIKQRITLLYIQPGKPTQNPYSERFNRIARHEWPDLHFLESIEQAQLLATQWLWTYNDLRAPCNERPHTAIGGIPPRQLLNAA